MRRFAAPGLLAASVFASAIALQGGAGAAPAPPVAQAEMPKLRATVVGTVYPVDPRFDRVMADNIARARKLLKEQREQGKLIAYVSTPISPRGGGHEPTNKAISSSVKKRLEAHYGKDFYALDPGEFALPDVDGKEAQGGDYLWMWTEILAGPDGAGKDFDLCYFVGPGDVALSFGVKRSGEGLLEAIDRYIERTAKADAGFRKEIAENADRKQAFRRFYAVRASVAYSKGAHDEWNLFVKLNRKRGVGEQVALWFDGRALSPAEMETELTPGYEAR